MLSNYLKGAIVVFIVLSIFTSCKKNRLVKNETGEISQENTQVQSDVDGAIDDANNVVSGNNLMRGSSSSSAAGDICGGTVDTTQRSQGVLTVTFDGVSGCNGRIRSGKLKLTLLDYASGKRWKDQNAILQVDFIEYYVKRQSDNKSLTFNGISQITNISGGHIINMVLGLQPNVIHKVTSNELKVKFDDGKTSTFNISRQYTHTYSNSVYEIKGEGMGTNNGLSNLENWGTTRDGDHFTSQVVEPVIWNSTCGANKLIKGKLDIKVDSKEFALVTTLGVNSDGTVTTSGCPWGIKVEWKYKNKTGSKLYPYN